MMKKQKTVSFTINPPKRAAARPAPALPRWAPRESNSAKTIRLLNRLIAKVGKISDLLQTGSCKDVVTKHDLLKLGEQIMAEAAVVIQNQKETIASIKQVNLDIAETQTKITALDAKIAELQKAIDEGGSGVPQEIADLAAEAKDLAKAADEALPNPVVVPPVDPPVDPNPQARNR